LQKFKNQHELPGTIIEITPQMDSIGQVLLRNYQNIIISNNRGQVAINSPGTVQANTINLKTTKQKVTIAPTEGSIASDLEMRSYIKYLISKYNDYQKQDTAKTGKYKYMAIYNAIERKFERRWEMLAVSCFEDLVDFLMYRIDNTKIGRIKKKAEEKRYHSYKEHIKDNNA